MRFSIQAATAPLALRAAAERALLLRRTPPSAIFCGDQGAPQARYVLLRFGPVTSVEPRMRCETGFPMRDSPTSWNHNTHYHPVIFDAIPPGCERALDVGCGEGTLTRQLRRLVPEVVGIDSDPASIAAAQAHRGAGDIRYVEGDALAYGLTTASFDLVTAVASLHHVDAETALARLSSLLRPGGVLAVIGLARSSLGDLPIDIAAIVPNRLRRLRRPYWQHPSPTVWPPPESYASTRRIVARALPGARFQRRLYWRYTLVWVKP